MAGCGVLLALGDGRVEGGLAAGVVLPLLLGGVVAGWQPEGGDGSEPCGSGGAVGDAGRHERAVPLLEAGLVLAQVVDLLDAAPDERLQPSPVLLVVVLPVDDEVPDGLAGGQDRVEGLQRWLDDVLACGGEPEPLDELGLVWVPVGPAPGDADGGVELVPVVRLGLGANSG